MGRKLTQWHDWQHVSEGNAGTIKTPHWLMIQFVVVSWNRSAMQPVQDLT